MRYYIRYLISLLWYSCFTNYHNKIADQFHQLLLWYELTPQLSPWLSQGSTKFDNYRRQLPMMDNAMGCYISAEHILLVGY
jgi:hypothetical protein